MKTFLPNRRIVGVDFDGTLAVTDYPTIIRPIPEIIQYIKQAKINGDIIILVTCRTGESLTSAVKWCREQGIEFDYVNENARELIKSYGDCRKIACDILIDDKCVNTNTVIAWTIKQNKALEEVK